jgi:hypothetical protein
MNGTAVESATLAAVGYDEALETLRLEFRSRAVYVYYGVPGPVHEALLGAASKGRYFNEAIRGRFPYVRAAKAKAGAA